MEVGLQKIHEDEWSVHIGCARMKIDRFTLALLHISLEQLIESERGHAQSPLQAYVNLGLKMRTLSKLDLQKLLRELQYDDLLILLRLAEDVEFSQQVQQNIGSMIAKQLSNDLQQEDALPTDEIAKLAIRRLVEKMFQMEAAGEIDFYDDVESYI